MAYFTLLFGFVMAVMRRWLGGGFFKCYRIYKNIVYVSILVLMYVCAKQFPSNLKETLCFLWTIGWMIRFYNHTHGDYFWLDSTEPDEERSWWVGKVLKLIYGKGKYYNFAGNFLGLMLGYLVPAILASITMPTHWFWLAGIATPCSYVICEFTLQFTGRKMNFSEYLSGFTTGIIFFLSLCGI